MASLYVLGRACGYGNVGMLSGMSETAVRDSLITFCKKVVDDLHHVHVRLPEGDDLKDGMRRYSRKGFPGAIGSIDVTHVLWDRVPAAEATDHAGKEGKPTLAFQVIVDFTRRVLANPDGFAGAENDMTISRLDEAIGIIRTQQPYTTQAFELYDANGNKQTRHGAYLLCDGGYLKWPIMQCPMKTPGNVEAQQFSKQLESVRKDVECFFGIVKGRFRFLKSALLYRDKGFINNAFSTCCVLHNILHAWDGLGRLEDEDWAGVDGEPEDGSLDHSNGLGHGGVGGNEDGASEEDQAGFYKLRDELVINFAQMKARKQLKF